MRKRAPGLLPVPATSGTGGGTDSGLYRGVEDGIELVNESIYQLRNPHREKDASFYLKVIKFIAVQFRNRYRRTPLGRVGVILETVVGQLLEEIETSNRLALLGRSVKKDPTDDERISVLCHLSYVLKTSRVYENQASFEQEVRVVEEMLPFRWQLPQSTKAIWTGRSGSYFWVETYEHHLRVTLGAVPSIVLGKHIVIAAVRGLPMTLTTGLEAESWSQIGDAAISPILTDVGNVPVDTGAEWYVFNEVPELSSLQSFVNDPRFILLDASGIESVVGKNWPQPIRDQAIDTAQQSQAAFWFQLATLDPVTYVCQSERLTIVTRDEMLRDWFITW